LTADRKSSHENALIELCAGNRRALVAPHVGGALAAFYDIEPDAAKLHWLRPASVAALAARDPLGMSSFPLLPYCNRLRDARFTFQGQEIDLCADGNPYAHALHGHAWRRPWRVGVLTESTVELRFAHEPCDVPGYRWPFRYEASQRIELTEEGLFVSMTARNLDTRPMPFGMGHHPYYPRTAATRIMTRARAMWHATPDLLPTHLGAHLAVTAMGEPAGMSADAFDLDNNFAGWSRAATIVWPDEGRWVTLTAEPPFDHMVVYAPAAHPELLCVEPVSNTADFLNLDAPGADVGGCVLQPGQTIASRFGWTTGVDQ
jgi:aldose 1-epimerase